MEARKLTSEEIDQLFDFCWCNSVKYYEIQAEIVDHMASSIEKKWEENPGLSFSFVLEEVTEQFGGNSGLAKIAEEREKIFRRNYNKLFWSTVAKYFKLPKIIITFCMFMILFWTLQITPNPRWVIYPVFGIGFLAIAYFLFIFRRNILIKNAEFDFLFNKISAYSLTIRYLPASGAVLVNSMSNLSGSPLGITKNLIFAGLISLSFVFFYGDCFVVMRKLRENFNTQYPQFVKV